MSAHFQLLSFIHSMILILHCYKVNIIINTIDSYLDLSSEFSLSHSQLTIWKCTHQQISLNSDEIHALREWAHNAEIATKNAQIELLQQQLQHHAHIQKLTTAWPLDDVERRDEESSIFYTANEESDTD